MDNGFRKELIEQMENGTYMGGRRLLRALLANGFSGKDMPALADELLFTFPSVKAVLEADYASLMTVDGMTRPVALYLLAAGNLKKKTEAPLGRIKDIRALIAHAQGRLKDKDCEYAELYLVDRDGRVSGFYRFTSRLKTRVFMDAQDFISKIASGSPYGFYVLHNHVGKSPAPSDLDDGFTARLLSVYRGGGAVFLDHCIIAGKNWFSYRESGRMQKLRGLSDADI